MGWVIPTILGKGQGFPGIGPPLTFWPFMASLRTVMALVGVSFSMIIYYNERIMRLKVCWKSSYSILGLVGSNQFLSYSQRLCHSFNGCALPPSLLSHKGHSQLLEAICNPCHMDSSIFKASNGKISLLFNPSHVLNHLTLPC